MAPDHRRACQTLLAGALSDPSSRLAITGATGWLGVALGNMASLAGLTTANGRLRLFGSKPRRLRLAGDGDAMVEALIDAPPLLGEGWRVAHFAGLGKERETDRTPVEFAAVSDAILRAVLDLTEPAVDPRMIFTSSGAVYRAGADRLEDSPYGWVKRAHEGRLTTWCRERSIPLVIARVFNVGGPYGNKRDLYALSSIIDAVLAREPIVLRARHRVVRSYVHVEQLVAMLLELANPAQTPPISLFDTGGAEVIELGDLAERIRAVIGDGAASPIDRRFQAEPPEDRYVGDAGTYNAALSRMGLTPATLDQIIRDAAGDQETRVE